MNYRSLCSLGAVVTRVFGAGFLAAPGPLLSLYGITGSDAPLMLMTRYFGAALVGYAAAMWGFREVQSDAVQRHAAPWLAAAQVAGLLVSLECVLAGTINALGWSSVAIYGFFAIAWARLAMGSATTTRLA